MQGVHAFTCQSVERLTAGDHACLVYRTDEEQRAALAAYVRAGLQRGEKVVCILDEHDPSWLLDLLKETEVDVTEPLQKGQLVVLTSQESYEREEPFHPEDMMAVWKAIADKAWAEGYAVMRITGEMGWILRQPQNMQRLLEYEAKLNNLPQIDRFVILCQYDRLKFPADVLQDVVRTHPLVVEGGVLHQNFFYVPPQEFLREDLQDIVLERMFLRLRENTRRTQALENSYQALKRFFQNATDIAVQISMDGGIVALNNAALRLLGYEKDEIIGKAVDVLYAPAWREKIKQLLFHWQESGQILHEEVEMVTKQGEIFPVILNAGLVMGEEGKNLLPIWFHTDLREKRRLEDSLRESEQKYRTMYKNMAQGAFYQRADGALIDVNDAALEILGLTRDEFLGRTSHHPQWKVVNPDGTPIPPERHPSMLALGSGQAVRDALLGVFNPKKGEMVWLMVNAIPQFKNGEEKPSQVFVTLHDLTELLKTQKALQISETKYKTLFSLLPVGITLSDSEEKIAEVNAAAERMLGIPREEHEKRRIDSPEWRIIRPDGSLMPAEEYASVRALRENRLVEGVEMGVDRGGGDVTWIHVTATPIPLQDYGVAIVYSDITARRQAEDALRKSEQRLQQIAANLPGVVFQFCLHPDGSYSMPYLSNRVTDLFECSIKDMTRPVEMFECVHPDDQDGFMRSIEVSAQKMSAWEYEYRIVGKYGRTKWLHGSSKPRRAEDGSILWDGVLLDITARKQAEEQLQKTSALLETILDHTPALAAYLDPQFNFLRVNRAYAMADERQADFFPGKNHFDLYPNAENEAIFRRVLETGEPYFASARPFEYLGQPERGKSYWDWSLVPIKDAGGKTSSLLLTLLNVTSRVHAQSLLAESEARYHTLFTEALNPIFLTDSEGTFLDANPAALRFLECEHKQLLQKKLASFAPSGMSEKQKAMYQTAGAAEKQEMVFCVHGALKTLLVNRVPVQFSAEQAQYFIGQDITEIKRMMKDLENSESCFRELVDHSPEAVLVVQDGKYVYANPAAEKLLGYGREELVGMPALAVIEPEYHQAVRERMQRIVEQRSNEPIELRIRHKSGKLQYSESVSVAIQYNDRPAALVISRDITRQREDHAKILFQADLLNSVGEAVIATDASGKIQFWNRFAETLYGWRAEEVMGKNIMEVTVPQPSKMQAQEIMDELKNGKGWSGEFLVQRKDGSEFFAYITDTPLFDEAGNLIGVIGISQDITWRKQAEAALRESEERYRQIFTHASDGIFIIDVDEKGRMVYIDINPAEEKFVGQTRQDFCGHTVEQVLSPHQMETVMAKYRRCAQEGTILRYEETLEEEHATFTFHTTLVPMKNEHGRVTRIIGFSQDITKIRHAQEEDARRLQRSLLQTEKLGAIVAISNALRKAQTYDEALPLLVKLSAQFLGADYGALMLVEGADLRFASALGGWKDLEGSYLSEAGLGIWDLIRAGEIVSLAESMENGQDKTIAALRHTLPGPAMRVLVPLKVRELAIGLLALGFAQAQEFEKDQRDLASAIGEIAGNTLQRMRLVNRMEKMVYHRSQELNTLYEVMTIANVSLKGQEGLQNALEKVLDATESSWGSVILESAPNITLDISIQARIPHEILEAMKKIRLADSVENEVMQKNQPVLLTDTALDKRMYLTQEMRDRPHAYIGVPMHLQGRVIGALWLVRAGRPYGLDEITLLGSIADHLALVVENVRLREQAEQAAALQERARLARDLHDSATQSLYSATLYADASLNLLEQGNLDLLRQHLTRLSQISHLTLKDLRLLVYQLRPQTLQEEGLAAALHQRVDAVERRVGIAVELDIPGRLELPPAIEETLFWIAIEALNNALKHANPKAVKIVIAQEKDCITLTVQDDGMGFDPQKKTGGMGLVSMRQRMEMAHGSLEITSESGAGTKITARILLEG